MVPKFQLKIYELFFLPYNWEVWIVLLVLFTILQAVYQLCPNILRNDPILLSICGYERYDLNKSAPLEKMILFPVIALMFVMTCAYESKLMSFIASRPTSRHIRTMQDLAKSNLKIKVNLAHDGIMFNIPMLAHSLVNISGENYTMDRAHAYVSTRSTAEDILPLYFDAVNKFNRYEILEQSIVMYTPAYLLAYRSPLAEVLYHTQAVLIESGLWRYGMQAGLFPFIKLLKSYSTTLDEMLHLEDLHLAWTIVTLGLIVSGMVCVTEIIVYFVLRQFQKRKNKI